MEFFAYPRFFNCIVVFKLSVTRAAVVVECATTKKGERQSPEDLVILMLFVTSDVAALATSF